MNARKVSLTGAAGMIAALALAAPAVAHDPNAVVGCDGVRFEHYYFPKGSTVTHRIVVDGREVLAQPYVIRDGRDDEVFVAYPVKLVQPAAHDVTAVVEWTYRGKLRSESASLSFYCGTPPVAPPAPEPPSQQPPPAPPTDPTPVDQGDPVQSTDKPKVELPRVTPDPPVKPATPKRTCAQLRAVGAGAKTLRARGCKVTVFIGPSRCAAGAKLKSVPARNGVVYRACVRRVIAVAG